MNKYTCLLCLLLFGCCAQQKEYSYVKKGSGETRVKWTMLAQEQTLELSAANGVELTDMKVLKEYSKYDPGKQEVAGFAAIAGALVTPTINAISTGIKRHSENRALSFTGTHDARNTWTKAIEETIPATISVPCMDVFFDCAEDNKTIRMKSVQKVQHVIPSARYKRKVMTDGTSNAVQALRFILQPERVGAETYYFKLDSLHIASTPAHLTNRAKYITLEIKPTISYFDGEEKKTTELGTMRVGLVTPGEGVITLPVAVTSDQFRFKDSFRFTEMAVSVTETNPYVKISEKKKDAVAAYNTDDNKEAITNVINLLIPQEKGAEGSGDGGAQEEGSKDGK